MDERLTKRRGPLLWWWAWLRGDPVLRSIDGMKNERRKLAAYLFLQIGATVLIFATLVYGVAYFLMMHTVLFSGAGVINPSVGTQGRMVRISYSRAPVYFWSGKPAEPRPFWDYFFMPAWRVDLMLRPEFWQWQDERLIE